MYRRGRRARAVAGASIAIALILVITFIAIPYFALETQLNRKNSEVEAVWRGQANDLNSEKVRIVVESGNMIRVKNEGTSPAIFEWLVLVGDRDELVEVFLPSWNASEVIIGMQDFSWTGAGYPYLSAGEEGMIFVNTTFILKAAAISTLRGKTYSSERQPEIQLPPGYAGEVLDVQLGSAEDLQNYANWTMIVNGQLELYDQETGRSYVVSYKDYITIWDTDGNGRSEIILPTLGPLVELDTVTYRDLTYTVDDMGAYYIRVELDDSSTLSINGRYGITVAVRSGDVLEFYGFRPLTEIGGYINIDPSRNEISLRGFTGFIVYNGDMHYFDGYLINEPQLGERSIDPLTIDVIGYRITGASLLVIYYRFWYVDNLDDYNSLFTGDVTNTWIIRVGVYDETTDQLVMTKEYMYQTLMTYEQTGPPLTWQWVIDSASFPLDPTHTYHVRIEIRDPYMWGVIPPGDYVPADMYIDFEFLSITWYG